MTGKKITDLLFSWSSTRVMSYAVSPFRSRKYNFFLSRSKEKQRTVAHTTSKSIRCPPRPALKPAPLE